MDPDKRKRLLKEIKKRKEALKKSPPHIRRELVKKWAAKQRP